MVLHRLWLVLTILRSPDEFIMASVSLYLDFLNLFLYVLRLLNSRDD